MGSLTVNQVRKRGRFDPCHTHMETAPPPEPHKKCIACNIRRAWHARKNLCKRCWALIRAENTWQRYGLPAPGAQWLSDKQFIRKYNELIAQGLVTTEIAATLGMNPESLARRSKKLRLLGFQIDLPQRRSLRQLLPQEPRDRSLRVTTYNNAHGGGKWGVTGCNCGPCLDTRRRSRREWMAANPERRRGHERRYREKRKNKDTPP